MKANIRIRNNTHESVDFVSIIFERLCDGNPVLVETKQYDKVYFEQENKKKLYTSFLQSGLIASEASDFSYNQIEFLVGDLDIISISDVKNVDINIDTCNKITFDKNWEVLKYER